MATSKFKYIVDGSEVYAILKEAKRENFTFNGKPVIASKNDEVYILETLTGQEVLRKPSACEAINDEDFNTAVASIVGDLEKFIDKGDTMAKETDTSKAELDTAKSQVQTLEADKKTLGDTVAKMTDEIKALTAVKSALEADMKAMKAKLDEYVKAEKAKSRMSKLQAVKAFDGTEADAVKEFGDMSDETFAAVVKMAEAQFSKLAKSTDQTLSNLPKSTDQTLTNLTKSTEAAVADATKTSEAVAEAKVDDKDKNDLAVAAGKETVNAFQSAISKFVDGKKSEKNSK